MNEKEVSAVSFGRGRGRGRARISETDQPTAPAPGVSSHETTHVGRGRAYIGRGRGDAAIALHSSVAQKPRGSPPADRSSPDINKQIESMQIISMAPRPGYGTLGRKYRMFTNHFEIKISSAALAVQRYHVTIIPADVRLTNIKLTRDDNRLIFWKCFVENKDDLGLTGNDSFYKVAFDSVNLCLTLNPLNVQQGQQKTYEVSNMIPKKNNPILWQVSIQHADQILVDFNQVANFNLLERSCTPIQVVDILLRQNRSCPYSECASMYYPFQNSIYLIPLTGVTPAGYHLGGGREIWKGLFTAAHVAQENRALVNMDIAHTAFYKSAVLDAKYEGILNYTCIQFLCDVLNEHEYHGKETYRPDQLREDTVIPKEKCKIFERVIMDLKICVDYQQTNCPNEKREYRVHSIDKSSVELVFEKSDGSRQSVAEYFKDTYTSLKYPRLFTLKIGPRKKPNGPPINPKRYIHFPVECCYLAKNQKVMKTLTDIETSLMIKTTCMAPRFRKEAIELMVHNTRFDEDPYLINFGIQLKPQMVVVDGRVLPSPTISYAGNRSVLIKDGVWRASGTMFHKPSEADGVAAVAFSYAPNKSQDFISKLMECCRERGMKMPSVDDVFFHLELNSSPQRVEIAFQRVLDYMKERKKKCDLIIVLLPQKGIPLYADVKYMAEIRMGIMTQCVINKTVESCSQDILMNLAFKINMKLGGVNCTINANEQKVRPAQCFFKEPTLVLGIDVTHPGPTERRKPSVACVVGSVDMGQMVYHVSTKIQKERTEHLVYLVEKVKERLLGFYKTTREKPKCILVYRDGVSEGQFQMVLREELRGIRLACSNIDPEYRPKITFIVVQKRHHTRFFPEDTGDSCGKHQNVHPGTVVDNYITRSDDFVFYICSHFGIQGTSRPTRYIVLHDDSCFSADNLQSISYFLCHCLSRCTRSVSIPAPVFYADLACTRARAHLQACIGDTLSDVSSSLSGIETATSSLSEEDLTAATTVVDNIQKTMYYM